MVRLEPTLFIFSLSCCLGLSEGVGGADKKSMALIKEGFYTPLYLDPSPGDAKGDEKLRVGMFYLDRYPVTKENFLDFVMLNPKWRKSNAKRVFADTMYLNDWQSDTEFANAGASASPVTFVSWFASRAYCHAQGKRLPSLAEWEYAAAFKTEKDLNQKILNWYSRPTEKILGSIGSTFANDFGVYDLHGLIWEWVEDFNSSLVTGESRADGSLDKAAFCGSGGLGASDFKNYAAFMRFGFRSSLQGSFTIANLGFRCARDYKGEAP